MAKRLCLSCSPDGIVLSLEALEHRSRRGVRSSAVKNRVWRILNSELDLLSSRLSSQKRYQHKGRIQPGRHAGSADDVAICNYPCIREDRAIIKQQVPRSPVCRHLSSRENTSRPAQQGSGADRKQEPFMMDLTADEREHFIIVHQCLLSITARHKQNIEVPRFRDAHVRGKPEPLHVADRSKLLCYDTDCRVRHA